MSPIRYLRKTLALLATAALPLLAAAQAADLTDAEVRKVDKDSAKITLKHAEIKSLDMPAMTMVFTVRDKALLDKVQAGDKVRVRVVSESGRYVVTEIQPAR
ncbi:MAG: copper-binding protein [Aquabacterium sp.]